MGSQADLNFAQMTLNDPRCTLATLWIIAERYPELRVAVALHDKASPELLEWLRQQGDPKVLRALECRAEDGPSSTRAPYAIFGLPLQRPSRAA